MIYFNENTIQSKFIKELLRSTYIPTIPVFNMSSPNIVRGWTYISGGKIVVAKEDWPSSNPNLVAPQSELDSTFFREVGPYVFGERYLGISSNFISNISYHDWQTHKALGDYLRAYRDIFGINLMKYYNCWGGKTIDSIRFNQSNEACYTEYTVNDGYTVLVVPIKYNQMYTVCATSSVGATLSVGHFCNNSVITSDMGDFNANFQNTIKFPHVSFSDPIEYMCEDNVKGRDDPQPKFRESTLTLFIQVPKDTSSKVVVLEGSYKKWCRQQNITVGTSASFDHVKKVMKTFIGGADGINPKGIGQIFPEVLELTQLNTPHNVACSSRLIEYLLDNVVCSADTNSKNIERVQKYTSSAKLFNAYGVRDNVAHTKGFWDYMQSYFIWNLTTQNRFVPIKNDSGADVNKDVEFTIMRGKE